MCDVFVSAVCKSGKFWICQCDKRTNVSIVTIAELARMWVFIRIDGAVDVVKSNLAHWYQLNVYVIEYVLCLQMSVILRWLGLPPELCEMIYAMLDRCTRVQLACALGIAGTCGREFVREAIKYGYTYDFAEKLDDMLAAACDLELLHMQPCEESIALRRDYEQWRWDISWWAMSCGRARIACDFIPVACADQMSLCYDACKKASHAVWCDLLHKCRRVFTDEHISGMITHRIMQGRGFEFGIPVTPAQAHEWLSIAVFRDQLIGPWLICTRVYDWLQPRIDAIVLWDIICELDFVPLYIHACGDNYYPCDWHTNIANYRQNILENGFMRG